jgi:S1-C subfamily serine protease
VAPPGIKDNPTVFQTTVPIQPGNSGGPLFNDKGEVVGLTTSSFKGQLKMVYINFLNLDKQIRLIPSNVNTFIA